MGLLVLDGWRISTWGDEVTLNYGKALRGYDRIGGRFRVFGTNGPVGWHDEALAPGPGVILGRKGAYRGVHYSPEAFWVIDTAYYLTPKSKMNMRWLYYAAIHYRLGSIDDGSPIPSTTRSAVSVIDFVIPPLHVQDAIAAILGSLDDKIELNRRMNKTLEAMAQAIFRDWFVDFGPTRRKLAGITDPVEIMGGLVQDASRAAELAKLFPDGLDDSGLPEGWTEKPLGEIVEIVGGSTPSTKVPEYWNDGVHPWATPKDLSNNRTIFLHKTERKITDFGLQCISSGLSPAGSVLLSSRAPIGYLAIADKPTAVNQGFIVMRPSPTFPTEMAYLWCQANMDLIKANANGSTFQEISKGNFRRLVAIYPTPELVSAFVSVAKPLFAMICAREQESETLAATRDLLLPKLMSGEIRLREAEKIAEAAQ